MGRDSKYRGGTKVVPFRLPIEDYKAVRARVQALLDEIAQESQYKSVNSRKPLCTSVKTTLSNNAKTKPIEPLTYQCGCSYDDGLFRRVASCKVDRGKHR